MATRLDLDLDLDLDVFIGPFDLLLTIVLREEISLLELFEVMEGSPLFDDCFLRHCKCGGTQENCRIFSVWINATKRVKEILEETTVATAAWSHPEHRFLSLPESLAGPKQKKTAKRHKSGTTV